MRFKAFLMAMAGLLLLGGCTYKYSITIVAAPAPPAQPAIEGAPSSSNVPNSEPLGGLGAPRAAEPSAEPFKASKPLSISPRDFQASQSQGGSMVNVLINLNLLKPTSVSTDAQGTLSGIPGF